MTRFPRNGLQLLRQIGKCSSVGTQKQSRKKGSRFEAVHSANDIGKDRVNGLWSSPRGKTGQLQSLVSSFASRAVVFLLETFPKNVQSQGCGTGFALTKAEPVLTELLCFQCFLLQLGKFCQRLFPIAFCLCLCQGQGHTTYPMRLRLRRFGSQIVCPQGWHLQIVIDDVGVAIQRIYGVFASTDPNSTPKAGRRRLA